MMERRIKKCDVFHMWKVIAGCPARRFDFVLDLRVDDYRFVQFIAAMRDPMSDGADPRIAQALKRGYVHGFDP